jgi:hypothetical protein
VPVVKLMHNLSHASMPPHENAAKQGKKRKHTILSTEHLAENNSLHTTEDKPKQSRKRVKIVIPVTHETEEKPGNPSESFVSSIVRPDLMNPSKLRNYILFKAFDIVGDGGYRRFLLKNKNNGEAWAVSMYNDTQHTNRCLRTTLQLIGQLAGNVPCVKLFKICQRVTNDMNPPALSTHGWCICALTGMRTENTTQIGRSNKGDICHVHRKFHIFFTMLWFISRFELCIKYATLQWLQENNSSVNNIQTLCEKLQKDQSFTESISKSIIMATQHVTDSIIMHVQRMGRGSMLHADP